MAQNCANGRSSSPARKGRQRDVQQDDPWARNPRIRRRTHAQLPFVPVISNARAVVVMTFYDEQTGADVASFLGISEANVRVIRHRAIHQLSSCPCWRGGSRNTGVEHELQKCSSGRARRLQIHSVAELARVLPSARLVIQSSVGPQLGFTEWRNWLAPPNLKADPPGRRRGLSYRARMPLSKAICPFQADCL
jgi:hypothetical protein